MIGKLFELFSLPAAPRYLSEFSFDFVKGMAARMCTSRDKYGAVAEAYPAKLDALASALVRIERYLGPDLFEKFLEEGQRLLEKSRAIEHRREHGNLEYLMDAGNFIMIEFMCPRHPEAHFKAEDSASSPGRVNHQGVNVGHEANTSGDENLRRGGSKGHTAGGFYKHGGD